MFQIVGRFRVVAVIDVQDLFTNEFLLVDSKSVRALERLVPKFAWDDSILHGDASQRDIPISNWKHQPCGESSQSPKHLRAHRRYLFFCSLLSDLPRHLLRKGIGMAPSVETRSSRQFIFLAHAQD